MFASVFHLLPSKRLASHAAQGLLPNAQAATSLANQIHSIFRSFSRSTDSTRRRRSVQGRLSRSEYRRSVPRLPHASAESSDRDSFAACNVPGLILSPALRESTPTWKDVCQDSYFGRLFILRLKLSDRFQVNLGPRVDTIPAVDQSAGDHKHNKQVLIITSSWIQPSENSVSGSPSAGQHSRSRLDSRGLKAAEPDADAELGSRSGSDSEDCGHVDDSEDEWCLDEDDSDVEDLDDSGGEEEDGEGGKEEASEAPDALEDENGGTRFMSAQHVVYGYWTKVPYG